MDTNLFFYFENNFIFTGLDNYDYKDILDKLNFNPGNRYFFSVIKKTTTFYPDFWPNLVNDYICHPNHNDKIRSFSYKPYTSFYVIWIHYNVDVYFDNV